MQRIVAQSAAPDSLRAQLSRTRAEGYALSENELQQGVVGAAVPLAEADGAVRFSLAVLMPSHRAERLATLLPALLDAGRRIEAQVGQANG
ncbi:IclR family transcriptional regulator C-terminal domain-containing protein [Tabrizicola soli]|uniref:IclR family transcriptional regulator domain-containing protein n=1 Tax=Tabrizicola soli TaxID=2185115 RepID=UPI00362C7A0B